jgi:predicted nucleotidyltransferase component of viral defense system
MIIPHQTDIPHKLALYRLLGSLLDNSLVATSIYFKGGTCAAMLGYLDRFSVDLDFDLLDRSKKEELRLTLYQIFKDLDYSIKDESKQHLQFFLKYSDLKNRRNTLKLEITDLVSSKNEYQQVYLVELDHYCQAQTAETMFANKLVALKARWEKTGSIAGRDLYDIHYFFEQGFEINTAVVEDLRGCSYEEYLAELVEFVEKEVTNKLLFEDLNPLLPTKKMRRVVPRLKEEVVVLLKSYSN